MNNRRTERKPKSAAPLIALARHLLTGAFMACIALIYNAAQAEDACPPLSISRGATDYRCTTPACLWAIADNQRNHCNRNVWNLTGNANSNAPYALMKDIDWTLVRYPNHHRCLLAMVRYQNKSGFPFFRYERDYAPAFCYVRKAVSFAPNDAEVWKIMGFDYHLRRRYEDALKAYNKALELSPSNGEAMYNIGLVYFDMKNFDRAAEYADRASAAGISLPGLRNKLRHADQKYTAPPRAPSTAESPSKEVR